MASSSSTHWLRQRHFLFSGPCKHSSPRDFLRFQSLAPLARTDAGDVVEGIAHREHPHVKKNGDPRPSRGIRYGYLSLTSLEKIVERKLEEKDNGFVGQDQFGGAQAEKQGNLSGRRVYRRKREMGSSGISSVSSSKEKTGKGGNNRSIGSTVSERDNMGKAESVVEDKSLKKSKKLKENSPSLQLRIALDACSKKGDVMGAISLYDSALRNNVKLEEHHYNVLLYLCSSAATGTIQPGKSGSSSISSNRYATATPFNSAENNIFDNRESSSGEQELRVAEILLTEQDRTSREALDCCSDALFEDTISDSQENNANDSWNPTMDQSKDSDESIQVTEDLKHYALKKGFEIYGKICSENVPFNEAALTSVARMAMTMGNGEMAFNIVKQIKALGLTLRLRSYGPALFSFCSNGYVDRAFEVEQHMLESGIQPEETELAALLRVSVESRKSEKVYNLLQKLRTRVRQVSPNTAELIERWFNSPTASRIGKRKWDAQLIAHAMESGDGGWHGLGWLGKGKWSIMRTHVDTHGNCQSCNQKLVAIDIDPIETENFSRSVASIARKREKDASFEKFERWLDYYGPFEAVVDAANVGFFSQRRFSTTKVNAVVNGIRQKLPSRKWPLIIVHNRRLYGGKMEEPANKKLLEKWKNADAVYATPTGSNDDWYWLYAAVKCKALIITNDEMRDHLFQILGDDFFPKWKERHQVHFSFQGGRPEFNMPSACSVVIQESRKGHWHIPILSEQQLETGRTWLCITRANSRLASQECSLASKEVPVLPKKAKDAVFSAQSIRETVLGNGLQLNFRTKDITEIHRRKESRGGSILRVLKDAERASSCIIDFQI